MTRREQLAEVYARLPKVACKRLCSACCGPVYLTMAPAEIKQWDRLPPPSNPAPKTDLFTCEKLDVAFKTCAIYVDRPMMCRLWGVVDDPRMRCSFGCEPERWLTNAEAFAFLAEVREIG